MTSLPRFGVNTPGLANPLLAGRLVAGGGRAFAALASPGLGFRM